MADLANGGLYTAFGWFGPHWRGVTMEAAEIISEFSKLSTDERLELIHTLWDHLVASASDELPVTPQQRETLRERREWARANPQAGRPWRDVLGDIESEL